MSKCGFLILIIGFTLTLPNLVMAQGTSESITIVCSAQLQDDVDALTNIDLGAGSLGGAYQRPESMDGYCFTEMLNPLRDNLEKYGVSVNVVQYPPHTDTDNDRINLNPASMELYTTLSLHGAPQLILFPYLEPDFIKQSPILFADMDPQIYLDIPSENDKLAAANLATGIILYDLGKCAEADTYLRKAESTGLIIDEFTYQEVNTPAMVAISFYQGNCAILEGDFARAAKFFETAFPSDWEGKPLLVVSLQVNLAWIYFQQSKQEAAFNLLDSVVEATTQPNILRTKASDALTSRAQLYALAERYDNAISDLNTAIQLTPDNPELYTLRGQMYLYLYEWDNVLADYNKAIELDPTYADAYFLRGVLYYSILQTGAEHYPDALADFQRYLQLAPDGDHAADAQKYADQIQAQQNSLKP
jgi:tetratricopeptide (TPR) repeat protein